MRRRPSALLVVALVVAVLATALPGFVRAGAADDPPAPVPATPVLSARRLPAVLQGAAADPKLAAALDPFLDKAAGDQCAVVLDGGRVAYTRNADAPMVPASVLKLLTGTAALEGPRRRHHARDRRRVGRPHGRRRGER